MQYDNTKLVCDQIADPATPWRLFYTLYSQAGGQVLADNGKRIVLDEALATRVLTFIHQLATEGLMNANVDAGGGTAVFQAGDAGLYGEGEWNVTVFQPANMAFSMQPFPALFGHHAAQADSHTFILPRQRSTDPERVSMALTMIRSLLAPFLIFYLLFSAARFWSAMWHTILFTLVSTPPLVMLPLFFAIVVNRIKHAQWFFRLAFFLPCTGLK